MDDTDDVFHKTLSTSVMYSGEGGEPLPISPTGRHPTALPKSLLKRFESVDSSQRVSGQVTSLRDRLKSATDQLTTAVSHNERLSEELDTHKSSLSALQKDHQALKQVVAEKQSQKVVLEGRMNEMTQKVSELTRTVDEKSGLCVELRSELERAERRVTQLGEDVKAGHSSRQELMKQIQEMTKHKDTQAQENAKLTSELSHTKQQLQQCKQDHDNMEESLETEKHATSTLQETISELKMQLRAAEEKASQRQEDISVLQEQYTENKKKLQRELTAMRETLQAREDALHTLQETFESFQDQPNRASEEGEWLEKSRDYQQQIEALQQQRDKLQSEMKILKKEQKKQALRLEDKDKTIESLNKESKNGKKQLALIARQCNQLQEQLRQSDHTHTEQSMNGVSDVSSEQYKKLKQAYTELEESLHTTQREKSDLHKQLESLTENHCQEVNEQNRKIASQRRYIEQMQAQHGTTDNLL